MAASVDRSHSTEGTSRSKSKSTRIRTEYTCDGSLDWHGRPARRATTGGWLSARYIIAQQVFVNVAYFGISKNMVMYLGWIMHEGSPEAANFVSNWTGTAFIAPLLGALLADSYYGRYRTTLGFSVIFGIGVTLVAISTYRPSLRPPQCPSMDHRCEHATSGQASFLKLGLYIAAIAIGAFTPPLTVLGADQFEEEDEVEVRQRSTFFNWFYQALTMGSMAAAVGIVTIQENVSWGLGMSLSAGMAFLGLAFFLLGTRFYRFHSVAVGGNPLSRIAQVIVAAIRKCHIGSSHLDSAKLYEESDDPNSMKPQRRKILHTNEYTFLDKAAVRVLGDVNEQSEGKASSWYLCTVTQVEEVKCLIRLAPIFAAVVIYTTVFMQLSTLFVMQGATMDNRLFGAFKIPSASLSVMESLSVIFWVLLYDRALVPLVRKYTGLPRGVTDLQRMGIGLALSSLAMVVAALVEMKRLKTAEDHGLLDDNTAPVPMSVLWEIPQYFIIGASEIFTYIGLMEFFYDQSPHSLRSVGNALQLLTNAVGCYGSTVTVLVVNHVTSKAGPHSAWIPDNLNRGHIDRFYWLLALMSAVNLAAFVLCAKSYRHPPSANAPHSDLELQHHVHGLN